MSEGKSPVDRALDMMLFIHLGFLMNLEDELPRLAQMGRQQVNMARMFGQFAVKQGRVEAEKRMGKATEQAAAVVTQLGDLAGRRQGGRGAPSGDGAPGATTTNGAAAASAEPSPDVSELAITDYDSLSASQVVPRLAGLAAAELDAVRRYEVAHRARSTILSKIAQLSS